MDKEEIKNLEAMRHELVKKAYNERSIYKMQSGERARSAYIREAKYDTCVRLIEQIIHTLKLIDYEV